MYSKHYYDHWPCLYYCDTCECMYVVYVHVYMSMMLNVYVSEVIVCVYFCIVSLKCLPITLLRVPFGTLMPYSNLSSILHVTHTTLSS